jgi:hypothetical protein
MASQNRKILLFLDNAPVHIVDEENKLKAITCKDSILSSRRLLHVKIQFFPPNLTSLLQLLDAGIIRSAKALAHKHQVLQLLKKFEMGEQAADLAKKLQVIDAMKFMATSWGSVLTEAIQKCFKACGFDKVCYEECVSSVPEETENEVAELMERLGEVDIHYVQDCIGEYAIPCDESLIANLVAEYIDEGDEEDDSALDKGGIMAAVSDVSKKVPRTSRDALFGLKTALMHVTENYLFEQELPLLEIIDSVQKRSHSRLIQPPIKSFLIPNENQKFNKLQNIVSTFLVFQ